MKGIKLEMMSEDIAVFKISNAGCYIHFSLLFLFSSFLLHSRNVKFLSGTTKTGRLTHAGGIGDWRAAVL